MTSDQAATSGDEHRERAAELAAKEAEWEAARDAALVEADRLEDGAGKRVMDDPESMSAVADQITAARTRARLADAAAAQARQEAHAASVAALRADAADFDPQIERAQERLTEHIAKRDEMLAELVEFSNAEWRIHTVGDWDVQERVARGERVTMRHPKAFQMHEAIEEMQAKRQRILDQAERFEANPNWTPSEPPTPRDWQADIDEARAAAAQAEEGLVRAAARLETASSMQRAEAIEGHRAAQRRRDEAMAHMHTIVGQAEIFGASVQ